MYTFNDQMNRMFGGKVYKLSLSAGCTCPNRDGNLSSKGCIFCSAGGSGEFAANPMDNIDEQLIWAKRKVEKKLGNKTNFAGYMAYFQPFSNTYGDTERLAELFEYTAGKPEIVALSIATRPDCIKSDMIERLRLINQKKPVFVELGLQTVHEDTADYINRCYSLDVFEDTFVRLKAAGLYVVVHVIAGLPGEDSIRTKDTVKYLANLHYRQENESGTIKKDCDRRKNSHIDGIKIQILYILKNTEMENLLPEKYCIEDSENPGRIPKKFIRLRDGMILPWYTLSEYADLVYELSKMLPKDTAIHRLTGDPPRKDLILPEWTIDKRRVLNKIAAKERENQRETSGHI